MTNEETIILDFLVAYPETAFSRKEIARKAVRRSVYEENQRWADAPLTALLARKQVEIDDRGFYKYRKPDPDEEERRRGLS